MSCDCASCRSACASCKSFVCNQRLQDVLVLYQETISRTVWIRFASVLALALVGARGRKKFLGSTRVSSTEGIIERVFVCKRLYTSLAM